MTTKVTNTIQKKKTLYIAYNAGCNIWEVEPFNPNIEWHKQEYQGTKEDCEKYAKGEMNQANKSYRDEDYLIG
jgi:hypothetical protein